MTTQSRIRRIGWLAALAVCLAVYAVLHLQVLSVKNEVVRAEREIVVLEEATMLLETEYLTRSSQMQLARWNRVDFGFVSPSAGQFVTGERELAALSAPRAMDAPEPIQLARLADEDVASDFPKLVSPLTGKPLDDALVEPSQADKDKDGGTGLALGMSRPMRIPLNAAMADATQ